MPDYRRTRLPGGTFFFTLVNYRRQPFLTTSEARALLRSAWLDVRGKFPFTTEAVCLLPDHLHCIWSLPEEDANFSLRWREIKRLFTKGYLEQIGPGAIRNASRMKRGEAAIWQRRFWEHTIRDEEDFYRHLDYIHYNPLNHGLVKQVCDWPWSSFHRYVKMGWYSREWGGIIDPGLNKMACGE